MAFNDIFLNVFVELRARFITMLAWVGAFLLLCLTAFANNFQGQVTEANANINPHLKEEIIAQNMMQYRGYLVSYVNSNAYMNDYGKALTGVLPDAKLTQATTTGFTRNSQVFGYLKNKDIYVYCACASNASAVAQYLATNNGTSAMSGVKLTATSYLSSAYQSVITGESFPATIPNGSAVYIAHE